MSDTTPNFKTVADPIYLKFSFGLTLLMLLFLCSCSASDAQRNHETRKLRFWQPAFTKPIEDRIGTAPPELVDYINLDNIRNGYPNRPRAVNPPDDFVSDVRAALTEIPAPVKRLIERKLIGIYFVNDLGGTAYTERVHDSSGERTLKHVAGYIVLDASVLKSKTANSWATWKENSPFMSNPNFKLDAVIEDTEHDNRKQAIQYILLHEIGHILSIGQYFNPDWNTRPSESAIKNGYPYFHLSWEVSKNSNQYVSIFDQSFPQRKDVVYYFGAKLPAAQMRDTYEALEQTNFPTLYAATNPHDDFAEAFVSYVHTVLMEKPSKITIQNDGKVSKVYESCWAEKRCAEKKKMLEHLLNMD